MSIALMQFVACPACRGNLESTDSAQLRCTQCATSYNVQDGIPILLPSGLSDAISSRIGDYEQKHATEEDPWHYGVRGAEILKYRFIVELIGTSSSAKGRALDVGCSSGFLSRQLAEVATSVFSIDVSTSAVMRARLNCAKNTSAEHCGHSFFVASATAFPFQPHLFNAVVISDGLYEWNLPGDLQQGVLAECERVLAPNGIAIFTDYMRPERFDEWIHVFESGPLRVLSISYLYDRPWYQLESAVHMIQSQFWVRAMLRSTAFARGLALLGGLWGKRGSKHVVLVAQKQP